MGDERTYYEVLQVSPDAATEVITSAYRTLMSKLRRHPDLGGDEKEASLINRAYEVLSDSGQRVAYDLTLVSNRSPTVKRRKRREDFIEKRRAQRQPSNATVSYCVEHDARWYPARVRDFSKLGVRLQSHEPFFEGKHVVIAPTNVAATAFHGTVRWTRMFHPSVFERIYEAGIEFSDQISDIDQRLSI